MTPKTKILVVTSKTDVTADLVVVALQGKGAEVARFNVEDYPTVNKITIVTDKKGLPKGYFSTDKFTHDLSLDSFQSIYYRPHEPPHVPTAIRDPEKVRYTEEQSLTALYYFIDSFRGFYMSRPSAIRRATSKTLQMQLASNLGIKIPKTLVTSDKSEFAKFYKECSGEVIAKNLTNEGIVQEMEGFIYANKLTKKDLGKVDYLQFCPVMFQEYIPKNIELRVTIVGRKVFPVAIDSQSREETRIDWRRYNLNNPPPHHRHKLPLKLEKALCSILDYFDLEFGAFDLILTPKKEYVFLELNANGQWGWIQYMTGLPIKEAIADLLIAAHH